MMQAMAMNTSNEKSPLCDSPQPLAQAGLMGTCEAGIEVDQGKQQYPRVSKIMGCSLYYRGSLCRKVGGQNTETAEKRRLYSRIMKKADHLIGKVFQADLQRAGRHRNTGLGWPAPCTGQKRVRVAADRAPPRCGP